MTTRWPGGGLGTGGAKLHTNLNESLPETYNEKGPQKPLPIELLLGENLVVHAASRKTRYSAAAPHDETFIHNGVDCGPIVMFKNRK